MRVEYFARIRDCTGEEAIDWPAPVPSLGALLHALSARYGKEFERWVLEGDRVGRAAIVLVNGRDSRHLGGLDTPLHADDQIAIFPMIAGG